MWCTVGQTWARMRHTCFRTSELDRGCVGELSDRGDCGFWGDRGGCRQTQIMLVSQCLRMPAVTLACIALPATVAYISLAPWQEKGKMM